MKTVYADFPGVCYEGIYRAFDAIKPSGKALEGYKASKICCSLVTYLQGNGPWSALFLEPYSGIGEKS